MKPNFFAGVLTGFIMATLAGGWFAASQKLFTPAAGHAEAGQAAGAPERVYFATSPDGRLTELKPLSEPVINETVVISWAAQAMSSALSFSFATPTQEMRKTSFHFTPEGWRELNDMLVAIGWKGPKSIPEAVYTTAPTKAPVIRKQGVRDDVFSWVLEVPLVTTIRRPGYEGGISYTAVVVVARSRNIDDPSGISIASVKMLNPEAVPAGASAAPAP